MDEKIDFVIPWVDGSDKKWQEELLKHGASHLSENYNKSQYRDWDILKYWFRGVEMFAPWVNKVYFITWGHVPEFLNINHPKLVIVKHEDYIPKQYLPTFSSHTIELNLHRIKGLSENFVYFNDDLFIVKPLKKADFIKNGLPRDSAIIKPIVPARYDAIASLMVNNVGIINQHFNKRQVIRKNLSKWFNPRYGYLNLLNLNALPWPKFLGFYEQHNATTYNKATFYEVWDQEFEILDLTCKNKVRNFKTDVNQWVLKNWRIAKGEFLPRSYRFSKYIMVDSKETAIKAARHIESQSHKIICVNDHFQGEGLNESIKVIQEGFESIFSEKSEFEV